nr:hypothetical protein [uncultured Pseudomonas sp.]
MLKAGVNLLPTLATAASGPAANVIKNAGSAASSALQQYAQPPRPYHSTATPTQITSSGQVISAGHIQLEFTKKEQSEYGLPPAMGLNPEKEGTKRLDEFKGKFPNNQEFTIKPHQNLARPLGSDQPLPSYADRIDHGHLSPEGAQILHNAMAEQAKNPVHYVTAGPTHNNCVDEHAKLLNQLRPELDIKPPENARPQDLMELIRQANLTNR